MSEIINLRTRRKQAARDEKRKGAAESAARHGQSKAKTRLSAAIKDKAARDLDGHRRETD